MSNISIEPEKGLRKGTNWWGAFVIGLAGTILVTGIVPYVDQALGAAGIPLIGSMTIMGLFLCLCLAELACTMPERTGGIPSYMLEAFRPWGDTTARHTGGLMGWSYWLGWFPVAPINGILTASYILSLFKVSTGRTVDPLGFLGTQWASPLPIWVFVGAVILLLLIYIPSYLGIRLGAAFATVLGVVSMLPLTALIFLPFFKSGAFHWANVHNGTSHGLLGFPLNPGLHASPTLFFAWLFPISWNVIAMEAAACYIGECRNPVRDAKISLTLEGLYGIFVYIMTPIVFVGVLGIAIASSDPLTAYTDFARHLFGGASWVAWFIGIPLVCALALSVLNAIMGTGRSLYQASEDGVLPRFFEHKNRHGVPDWAMGFNVICSIIVVGFGSPLRIYIFSNSGYLLACAVVFLGYFLYRQYRSEIPRPYRLPEFFKWVALAVFIFWMVIYFFGGWNAPNYVVGPGTGHTLFLFGIAVVLCYFPLYWWRKWTDGRRLVRRPVQPVASTGLPPGPNRETPGPDGQPPAPAGEERPSAPVG